MQPQVQSLEQIIGDLNPVYQGSIDVINKRRAQLPAKFDAQRSALSAERVQGFNTINNQATNRGMSFSGIPLDEQATYLSTKYLPGLQQLDYQQNEADLSLDEALAKINQERRLKAMNIRQTQQSALEKYLAEQRQMAWEREKFAAQQALEREKIAATRAAAAGRSSGRGGSGVSAEQSIAQYMAKAGTRWRNGRIVTAKNAAENAANNAYAAGYGSYADMLRLAYQIRKRNFGED
jgi:hypothetical protein|nr:MAG TPA: hypothetical protein [Caudoviricetes sp.]